MARGSPGVTKTGGRKSKKDKWSKMVVSFKALSKRATEHIRAQPLDVLLWHDLLILIILYGAVTLILLLVGASLASALGLCCAIYFGLRVLLVIHLESVKWRSSSPCPQHLQENFLLRWYAVVREFFSFCLLYTVIQPLDRWVMPRLERRRTEAMRDLTSRNPYPILLIHGFFCNSIFWLPTRLYLGCNGVRSIYSITLSPPSGDIKDFSSCVAQKVDHILEETGADKIIILAHSMGGLVARHYIQNSRGHQTVAKLIAVATPHHGTLVALGAGSRIFRAFDFVGLEQMIPESSFLTQITEQEERGNPVPITNIFSYDDEIVVPQESSILDLEHAKNLCCRGVAHMSMVFSPSVNKIMLTECTNLDDLVASQEDEAAQSY